jgi:hypothetical protein
VAAEISGRRPRRAGRLVVWAMQSCYGKQAVIGLNAFSVLLMLVPPESPFSGLFDTEF